LDKKEVNQYSPLTLAFLGDAVYERFVRERLVRTANMPAGRLHREAVKRVRAGYQSRAVDVLTPLLTEEETVIIKRGRNARGGIAPKNTSRAEYRRATALETLFGYLCLTGDEDRLAELFDYIWDNADNL
jgi:ribonuclease-3 family protein